MVHRLHNRNTGYAENFTTMHANNQTTLQATEGATALDLNNVVSENNIIQESPSIEKQESLSVEKNEETINDALPKDISMENAAYLQNAEDKIYSDEFDQRSEGETNFEVDSIELATPELFSEETPQQTDNNEKDESIKIFEDANIKTNTNEEKEAQEPEMFEDSDLEKNFEIPAFLRRQKN